MNMSMGIFMSPASLPGLRRVFLTVVALLEDLRARLFLGGGGGEPTVQSSGGDKHQYLQCRFRTLVFKLALFSITLRSETPPRFKTLELVARITITHLETRFLFTPDLVLIPLSSLDIELLLSV